MRVDLHIHSTASDGRWTPEQLVQQVQKTGIDLFAVADHDAVGSVRPVEKMVRGSGLSFIRAVEISSTLDGQQFHLLAYGIEPKDPRLLRVLNENRAKLEGVNEQVIHKLIKAGYPVSQEDYHAYENDVTRGGWKALNYLIDQGICQNVADFFKSVLVGEMAPTYPDFAPLREVTELVHRSGGLVVCAHPGGSIGKQDLDLLETLVACGIDGLECYSPYHDPAAIRRFLDFCQQHQLVTTAGSDCHGGFARRTLGMPEAYSNDLNLGPLLEHVIR